MMIPLWAVGLLWLAHVDLRVFSFSTGGFGKRIFHINDMRTAIRSSSSSLTSGGPIKVPIGGKIVITGIGEVEEDEFTLQLLNEQSIWSAVLLASTNSAEKQKRFLSRTARYSGLLNILEFPEADINVPANLTSLLSGANAWLAFNVERAHVESYADAALQSNVQRVIFTTAVDPAQASEGAHNLPEFEAAIAKFSAQGKAFTGIRHGTVLPGDENNNYEIVNATQPLACPTVHRGVLGRVATELLRISVSHNDQCGLSGSDSFTDAYLSILRSSGLTRKDEVLKIYTGGIQRVKQSFFDDVAKRKQEEEEELKKKEARKEELAVLSKAAQLRQQQQEEGEYDDELEALLNPIISAAEEEKYVKERAAAILEEVLYQYQYRMVAHKIDQNTFEENNLEKARALATQEFREERERKISKELEKRANQEARDKALELQQQQYSRLLAIEKKEILSQQQISDVWVKYLYLLLGQVMEDCATKDILFHNLDEFQQTLQLREKANQLRAQCRLPKYDVVYDPLDAQHIVATLSQDAAVAEKFLLNKPADTVYPLLQEKYGRLLKNVAALRGAHQIIEVAIETLKQDLPPPPPTVEELRAMNSKILTKKVEDERLNAIKYRNQIPPEKEYVGRL